MPSASPKPSLTILDVGHGNAAVLQDEFGVVVIDTGRRGTDLVRYLNTNGINNIEALYLSHSDADHIGGAATLLAHATINIQRVYLNADPTQTSHTFRELAYAVREAELLNRTSVRVGLTTDLNNDTPRKGTPIEILFPPASVAMSGVGGRQLEGNSIDSNSMSAALRIGARGEGSILLAGDIGLASLTYWREAGIDASATVLVFPHHGGNPGVIGDDELSAFATNIDSLVRPKNVVFSINRVRYDLPRESIVQSLLNCNKEICLACTELPDRYHSHVSGTSAWRLHLLPAGDIASQGSIECLLASDGVQLRFVVDA